jgi:hypothetical protein
MALESLVFRGRAVGVNEKRVFYIRGGHASVLGVWLGSTHPRYYPVMLLIEAAQRDVERNGHLPN